MTRCFEGDSPIASSTAIARRKSSISVCVAGERRTFFQSAGRAWDVRLGFFMDVSPPGLV
jgi:hypothetical protein